MDYFYLMVALFSCSCYTTLLDTQLFLFSCCGSYAPKASEVISCNREFEFEFKRNVRKVNNVCIPTRRVLFLCFHDQYMVYSVLIEPKMSSGGHRAAEKSSSSLYSSRG